MLGTLCLSFWLWKLNQTAELPYYKRGENLRNPHLKLAGLSIPDNRRKQQKSRKIKIEEPAKTMGFLSQWILQKSAVSIWFFDIHSLPAPLQCWVKVSNGKNLMAAKLKSSEVGQQPKANCLKILFYFMDCKLGSVTIFWFVYMFMRDPGAERTSTVLSELTQVRLISLIIICLFPLLFSVQLSSLFLT